MTVKQFDGQAKTTDIVAALDDAGAVLVTGLADPATTAAMRDQLRNHCAQRKLAAPLARVAENELFAASPGTLGLVGHRRVFDIADAVLLRHASSYQLSAATAMLIRAGADEQPLDSDVAAYPLRVTGLEWGISAIWALDDIDVDAGAPTLIPGSHRWDIMRLPDEKNMVSVAMPRGSVLFCMGWALHGWSSNRSGTDSLFVTNRYCLGWLRAEVNHALTLASEIVATYPEAVRRLLGQATYDNGRLGWYPQ